MKYQVIAHPNAKKSQVKKDKHGQLHVCVTQPAQDGKANRAIIKVLADYLKIKKSQIFLDSGARSKQKTFLVIGG